MAFMFNSSAEMFNSGAPEFMGVERERANIVTVGRLLMAEYHGKACNSMASVLKQPEPYRIMLNGERKDATYADVNRGLQKSLLLYCAKMACKQTGEVAPADMNELRKDQRKFFQNSTFLATLAGISRDVVNPVYADVMGNSLDWIAQRVTVPMGQTLELDVQSNDIFLFEDDSWGASRSKPANRLYSKPVTLNPTLRTAKVSVKWYQLVANDADMGRFFNSLAAGMYSKIAAMAITKMTSVISNTAYVPSALSFTNTSANWTTAASKVAMVNGTRYRNVIGIGHPTALSKALPSGMVNASSVNLDAALATMLGVDWVKYGYLGEYMGVRMMPLDDALVPGTINTTVTGMLPTDKIILMATNSYKPIYLGIEDGTPMQIQLNPSETADMSLDIIMSISVDAQPVVANKIGVITA